MCTFWLACATEVQWLIHLHTFILLQGLPYLDVRIKWPNDLYLNGLKVGGILCTSTYKSKKFNVSAGKQTHLLDKVYDPILFLWRALKLHTTSISAVLLKSFSLTLRTVL